MSKSCLVYLQHILVECEDVAKNIIPVLIPQIKEVIENELSNTNETYG